MMSADNPESSEPLFTRAEILSALRRILPEEQTAHISAEIAAEPDTSTVLYGDVLNALSILSSTHAAKVKALLRETEEQEVSRITEFKSRLRIVE